MSNGRFVIVQFLVAGFLAALSAGCISEKDKAIKEFERRDREAEHAYCSTNILVAEQGVENYREWLLDTNNPTEPALNRNAALYLINGRLFLIEEHIGNVNQAEKFSQESMNDYNKYIQYIQSLNLPFQSHPLQPISSKEELRARFLHIEKNLDVGWRKQS